MTDSDKKPKRPRDPNQLKRIEFLLQKLVDNKIRQT